MGHQLTGEEAHLPSLIGTYLSPYVARVRIQFAAKSLDVPLTPPPGADPWRIYKADDALRALNPIGKMPFILHGSLKLGETQAICEWVEDRWPLPALRPHDLSLRARDRYICAIIDAYGLPTLERIFGAVAAGIPDQIGAEAEALQVQLGVIDSRLESSPFAFGDTPSLADCALPPFLFFLRHTCSAAGTEPIAASLVKLGALARQLEFWPPAQRVVADMTTAFATLSEGD